VFSARVAAVKCRPVLRQCVVIFFWFSGIMHCMLLTFESGVVFFITTDEQLQQNQSCCFPMQAMLLGGFPWSQFN